MTSMERLIAPDQKCSRFLRFKRWSQPTHDVLSPILRGSLWRDTYIKTQRYYEQSICIFETTSFNTIDPNCVCIAERFAGLRRRANEISNHGPAGLGDSVAHPTHSTGVYYPILETETKIGRKVGTDRIRVKHHRIQ